MPFLLGGCFTRCSVDVPHADGEWWSEASLACSAVLQEDPGTVDALLAHHTQQGDWTNCDLHGRNCNYAVCRKTSSCIENAIVQKLLALLTPVLRKSRPWTFASQNMEAWWMKGTHSLWHLDLEEWRFLETGVWYSLMRMHYDYLWHVYDWGWPFWHEARPPSTAGHRRAQLFLCITW